MPLLPPVLPPPNAPGMIFNFLNPHAPKPQQETAKYKKQPITGITYYGEISPPSLVMTTPVSVCIVPLQKHPACSHIELKDNLRLHWTCRFNWASEIIENYTGVWKVAKALGGIDGISGTLDEFVAQKLALIAGLTRDPNDTKAKNVFWQNQSSKSKGLQTALNSFQAAAAVNQSIMSHQLGSHAGGQLKFQSHSDTVKPVDFLKNLKLRGSASSKISDSKERKQRSTVMRRLDTLLLPAEGASNPNTTESSIQRGVVLRDKSEFSIKHRMVAPPPQPRGEISKRLEERMNEINRELALAAAARSAQNSHNESPQHSPVGRLNKKFKAVSNILKMTNLLKKSAPAVAATPKVSVLVSPRLPAVPADVSRNIRATETVAEIIPMHSGSNEDKSNDVSLTARHRPGLGSGRLHGMVLSKVSSLRYGVGSGSFASSRVNLNIDTSLGMSNLDSSRVRISRKNSKNSPLPSDSRIKFVSLHRSTKSVSKQS